MEVLPVLKLTSSCCCSCLSPRASASALCLCLSLCLCDLRFFSLALDLDLDFEVLPALLGDPGRGDFAGGFGELDGDPLFAAAGASFSTPAASSMVEKGDCVVV